MNIQSMVKREIPNKTLDNTVRALLLNSSHKKEILWFTYQYDIWISLRTENILRGDVPYFLCHGKIPSYNNIKYGVWESTSSMAVLQERILMIDHIAVFMGYEATTGVILYWNLDQTFVIHRSNNVCFDEYNFNLSIEDNHTPCYLILQQHPESIIHISDIFNLILCDIDLTSTTFRNTTIII